MSTPEPDPTRAATEALETALAAVPGLRVKLLGGNAADPPIAVVGPPRLTWRTGCLEPTEAFFPVFIAVPSDDRWRDRLWNLVPLVVQAIDEADVARGAAVIAANPGMFGNGGQAQLPSYQFDVEVAL